MREAGFTYQQIGKKLDVPWGTIRSRCQSLGITPLVKVVHERNRPIKHPHPRWLIEMMYWDCELTTKEIGYELDISHNQINHMMMRMDIPRRTKAEAWALLKRQGRTQASIRYLSTEEAKRMSALAVKKRQRAARRQKARRRKREELAKGKQVDFRAA